MKKTGLFIVACICILMGCSSDDNQEKENIIAAGINLKVTSTVNQIYSGNIEAIKAVERSEYPSAVAVASKSKTAYFLENTGASLQNYRDSMPHLAGGEDDEVTNLAIIDAEKVVVTATSLIRESGEVTDCGGYLVAVINEHIPTYGGYTYAKSTIGISIGSMPDAVAISPDKRYAVVANEHDSKAEAWGKCTIESIIPSVSIVELSETQDDYDLKVVKTIQFSGKGQLEGGPREPEYIAFSGDGDTVAVTLQDSHEVAIFSLKEVLAKDGLLLKDEDVSIHPLAKSAEGYNPWPDGIVGFEANGKNYFAMAGEGNDTITIIDDQGNAVANPTITALEVPSNYPCLKDDDFPTAHYSPDSITSFKLGGRVYVAATLRYAGAVIVYDVTNPAKPSFEFIVRSGEGDIVSKGVCTSYSEPTSKTYPEGISSGKFGDAVYIWVANEGDSSVTSMRVEAKSSY